MHTHKVARACLGFQSGVRGFRRESRDERMVNGLHLETAETLETGALQYEVDLITLF